MEYVELLRARRVLTWFAGILFGLLAIGLILMFKDGPPSVQMSHDTNPIIPFAALLAGSSFAPLIIAGFVAVGLDAEYKTTAIAWTRPLSRLAIAARYVAIDAGAMLAGWLIALAFTLIPLFVVGLGKFVVYGTNGLSAVGLTLGCAAMMYALILLVAALVPGHGVRAAALVWAYAIAAPLLSLIGFPPAIRSAVLLLNYLSPLSYLGSTTFDTSGNVAQQSFVPGTSVEHTIAMWLIAVVAVVAAVHIWSKREVPA